MWMYLLAKFGDHGSHRNRDMNSYIKSYMNTFEKAELTDLIRHIARLLKSGIPIYNFEVSDTAGRKTRRRRTIATKMGFAFYANAKSEHCLITLFFAQSSLVRGLKFSEHTLFWDQFPK